MDMQTPLERLDTKVSDVLQLYKALKAENDLLRTEIVKLKAENEMKNQEIDKLTQQNAQKELEIEEIVSKIESIVG